MRARLAAAIAVLRSACSPPAPLRRPTLARTERSTSRPATSAARSSTSTPINPDGSGLDNITDVVTAPPGAARHRVRPGGLGRRHADGLQRRQPGHGGALDHGHGRHDARAAHERQPARLPARAVARRLADRLGQLLAQPLPSVSPGPARVHRVRRPRHLGDELRRLGQGAALRRARRGPLPRVDARRHDHRHGRRDRRLRHSQDPATPSRAAAADRGPRRRGQRPARVPALDLARRNDASRSLSAHSPRLPFDIYSTASTAGRRRRSPTRPTTSSPGVLARRDEDRVRVIRRRRLLLADRRAPTAATRRRSTSARRPRLRRPRVGAGRGRAAADRGRHPARPTRRSPRRRRRSRRKDRSKLEFSSTEPGSTFECSLDGEAVRGLRVAADGKGQEGQARASRSAPATQPATSTGRLRARPGRSRRRRRNRLVAPMRAIQITEFGGPEVLVVRDIDEPEVPERLPARRRQRRRSQLRRQPPGRELLSRRGRAAARPGRRGGRRRRRMAAASSRCSTAAATPRRRSSTRR